MARRVIPPDKRHAVFQPLAAVAAELTADNAMLNPAGIRQTPRVWHLGRQAIVDAAHAGLPQCDGDVLKHVNGLTQGGSAIGERSL